MDRLSDQITKVELHLENVTDKNISLKRKLTVATDCKLIYFNLE
jgi:hypothetical protein